MPEPVTAILNLGPASEAAFARAGIHSADEIRAMGPDAAYLALLNSGAQPHFIGYYVLVLGLQGRPWTDLPPEEKKQLRLRFDAIKTQARANPTDARALRDLEAALDAIGVVPRDRIRP